jgi:preprotein translocase subunit SecF
VLFTFFFILLYVWARFQWKLGVGAIAAALHDPIVILGFFAATQMTFDLPALAAILAVIGYSLNDTVVVFDRIRERFVSMRKGTSEQVIDASINETLSRTLMTSVTTLTRCSRHCLIAGTCWRGFSWRWRSASSSAPFVHLVASSIALDLKLCPRPDARAA